MEIRNIRNFNFLEAMVKLPYKGIWGFKVIAHISSQHHLWEVVKGLFKGFWQNGSNKP